MSVVYTNAVKISRMGAVTTAIGTTGVLEIGTASMATVLATFTLNNPAAGAATGAGVLTLSGFPKNATAAATGTAAAARIRTATAGTDIITNLTVGTSGTDIILDSTSITSSQTVTLNSATITHAA
jgi:hypothetical protein